MYNGYILTTDIICETSNWNSKVWANFRNEVEQKCGVSYFELRHKAYNVIGTKESIEGFTNWKLEKIRDFNEKYFYTRKEGTNG